MDPVLNYSEDLPFIFFDLGKVLLLFEHQQAWRQMAQLCDLEPETVRDVVFRSSLQVEYERGTISSEEFYREFCRQLKVQPDYGKLLEVASNIFQPAVEVIDFLQRLKTKGYSLGLLSNTCAAHWQWIEGQEFPWLKTSFEIMVLSFQVHSLKPDAEIYRVATEQAQRPAEGLLLIDDLAENVDAARNAGWDAIQFVGREDLEAQFEMRKLPHC